MVHARLRNWRSCPFPPNLHPTWHRVIRVNRDESRLRSLLLFADTIVRGMQEGCTLWYYYMTRPLHLPIAVWIPCYRVSELNLLIGGPFSIPDPEIKAELCHFTNNTASTYFPNIKYNISPLHRALIPNGWLKTHGGCCPRRLALLERVRRPCILLPEGWLPYRYNKITQPQPPGSISMRLPLRRGLCASTAIAAAGR